MRHWWLCIFALFLIACHDDEDDEPKVRYKQIAIVYMMAENSLSYYSDSDIKEIRSAVSKIPDSCAVVIYRDKSSITEQPKITLYQNGQSEQVLYEYKNDPISTDSTVMQQALDRIIHQCPADRYGLVMWSHGSGWIPSKQKRAIGIDNGINSTTDNGTEMEIPTLARVLKNTGVHWDYVFFDACFMQCVEVAHELRHVTDWCIGSPAEIPGNGAPYHIIMPDLFPAPGEAWRIAESYFNYYEYSDGLVISAIQTDQLDALVEATAPHIRLLEEYPPTDDIQEYLLFESDDQWKPEYFDMGSAMAHWLSDEDYAAWRAVAERAVPYRYATTYWVTSHWRFNAQVTDPDHIICASMYIPVEGHLINPYFPQCSWYHAAGWE